MGYNIAFHPPRYGSASVLEFDNKGHALFPMHSACAIIVQRVCVSDADKMTLQSYYNTLRKVCALSHGERHQLAARASRRHATLGLQ